MCQIGKGDARPLEKEQPQISNNMFQTRNRGGHETAVTKSVPSLNMWTSQLPLPRWESENNSRNLFVKAVVNSCAVRPLNFGGIIGAPFETLRQNVGAPQHRNSPNWVKSANVVCCAPPLGTPFAGRNFTTQIFQTSGSWKHQPPFWNPLIPDVLHQTVTWSPRALQPNAHQHLQKKVEPSSWEKNLRKSHW